MVYTIDVGRSPTFIDDVLNKSKQGVVGVLGFLALGGFASAMFLTLSDIQESPFVRPRLQEKRCPSTAVCIVHSDPAYRMVTEQWYAISEKCTDGRTPQRPPQPLQCDTLFSGGAVPESVVGECWVCGR